jgi:hypothetical protein
MSIKVYTEPFITNELLLLYSDNQLIGYATNNSKY